MMDTVRNQLTETAFVGSPISKTLVSALVVNQKDSTPWSDVLRAYREYINATSFVDRVLKGMVSSTDDGTNRVFGFLARIREAERLNLELRAAQAEKGSPINVTEQHTLSYSEVLSDRDATLRRIALSNCKKKGRVLLQKWHPDREGGDADVFDLCKSAINSGDVELVQILLYRFGDDNAVKEFDPVRIARIIRTRTVKFQGSQLFSVFRHYVHSPYDVFISRLLKLLSERLTNLEMMNIPGAFPHEEELHEEPDPN
jgi:hypothetical protein